MEQSTVYEQGLNWTAILPHHAIFFHMAEQNSVKINWQFYKNMHLPGDHNGI